VRVDPSQLEQVLLNLVVNARDAMIEGGTITVSTALEEIDEAMAHAHSNQLEGTCVTLRVQDTGEGMPPEVIERAFDPFFTTKEMGRGTGLGLATVYGIVKQSGGAVWLDSAPGRGTTATIQLRCEAPPSEQTEESTPGAQCSGKATGTILVAEDEPGVRRLVCGTLENCGYVVLQAGDGIQALELLDCHDGEINLLITDVVMPGMGGLELAQNLRSMKPDLSILFMSGYPDEWREIPGSTTDGNEFLPKPFTSDQLLERVLALMPRMAQWK
jgi:CheY-like chemotaxis protein